MDCLKKILFYIKLVQLMCSISKINLIVYRSRENYRIIYIDHPENLKITKI